MNKKTVSRKKMGYVNINGTALRGEIDKRGLKMNAVSEQLGYEASYLSKAIRMNRMLKSSMKLMQMMYGINPDIYEVIERPVEEVQAVEVVSRAPRFSISEDDAKMLHKLVYSAVYEAVKKALNE